MNFETIVTEYKTQDEKKVKGNSKDAYTLGPDINGDGQADPLYFNYARMADLDQDGILDLVVAANPDNPDTVVADLTGDGEPDLTQPGPLMVAVHRIGQPPEVRLALGDVNGDGLIDTAFAFDLDGDGLADTLAGLGA
jgi:hypothetical protein